MKGVNRCKQGVERIYMNGWKDKGGKQMRVSG